MSYFKSILIWFLAFKVYVSSFALGMVYMIYLWICLFSLSWILIKFSFLLYFIAVV